MTGGDRPDLTLIQLSDTHIVPEGQLMHRTVDTMANLVAAVETVEASGIPVAAFVLSGDLTDSGRAGAYRRLRSVVEPAAARMGAEVVYATGNHDDRAAFRTELLDEAPSAADYDVVRMIGGLRVVVLDSTEPGRHEGHLSQSQLDWLAEVLAEPAPLGTLLVTHHPPLPSPVPTVHLLRMRRGGDGLAAVLAGSDVRMIVTGHAHHTGCGALARIPVWVGPSTAYGVTVVPPEGRLRADADAAFSRIDVFGDHLVATAVPMSRAASVYDVEEAERLGYVREVVGSW
ncbi:metallophosphoesterase [Streptomyces sp. NA04227]|uniref:metallophosphoesterase n=1 Tax=Streptomyces sp. NA04227 TaxID=2742136 RepID=UPI001C37C286|nr:metallophosphoesterase [Streptomyces sp. NA04227]